MSAQSRVSLDGFSLTFEQAFDIACGAPVVLDKTARARVDASRKLVEEVSQGSAPVYGVNTGFGYFSARCINPEKSKDLQLNLVKSHASGWGPPLTDGETRLAMALRLNVLLKGLTGVRWKLCEHLFRFIEKEIYPLIPEHGSVGASGDLAPLAHLALPLVGLGQVTYKGEVLPAAEALAKAKLKPIVLAEKEGLGLINGTQIMLAVGTPALAYGAHLLAKADQVTALTYEAMEARPDALDPRLHRARGQQGQILAARRIKENLKGSYLLKRRRFPRVQDAYSLRCAPQIHGASAEAVFYSVNVVERELNAATDNPLVFADKNQVISGGNFHGQPLAIAFDIAAMALAEIGNVSERRLEQLLNPHCSGLPAFLSPEEGLQSGYMAAQYLSASLVNENKLLANPSCTDSIPGNVGVEDHVSMGMTSARKLKSLVEKLNVILAIEAVAACQAIDMRQVKPLGEGSGELYETVRGVVPPLREDRVIAEDIALVVDAWV